MVVREAKYLQLVIGNNVLHQAVEISGERIEERAWLRA